MRRSILLFTLGLPVLALAQTVVSGGGGHHSNATTAISYTIGEPVIATVSAAGTTLTQGFQQPWADITTEVTNTTTDLPEISVYPNPVRHTLHIAVDQGADAQHYFLHDGAGRLVTEGRLSSTLTDLDMQPYASGSYVLRVLGNDHSTLQTFKIHVTH